MPSENLGKYLKSARQRRLDEQQARKQQLAEHHEARRVVFEARSEPLNVHLVRILEDARADLAEAGAKLEYRLHSYNAAKQLENPRVDFQISGLGSPSSASSVYVVEIVDSGEVVIRAKQTFGDPDSTLTPRQFKPRTAASLRETGLTDVIKAAIDDYVKQGG
jgi:hypothetical protein